MRNYAHKAEILAPAGNEDSLKAAIDYGADAVYLGIDKYNARAAAQNFTLENLPKWLDYAHLFGVKVYLAVNILLNDFECEEAFKTIINAHNMGVDAVIVQDIGLMRLLASYAPEIKIHCSTQMGIHNHLGAKWALDNGAKRVILSRECSLEDIKSISQNVNIEIEHFILGALCVCFSGNCYYSSRVSGLSGNRGRCLQLCRKKYSLFNDKNLVSEGYLLSPADQNLTQYLNELIDAGVSSFKIEGRLKRPEYVAQAVKTVKKALENNAVDADDLRNLRMMFNRGGYATGYFKKTANYGNLIYPKHPAHIGLNVGKVKKNIKDTIQLDSGYDFKDGDGFKIFRAGEEVGNALACNGQLKFRGDIQVGDEVNITSNASLIEALNNFKRKLKVDFKYEIRQNKPIKITASNEDITIDYASEYIVSPAKTAGISKDDVFFSASRLSDTEFELNKISIDLDDNVFIPKSILNECRREAIRLLKEAIISKNSPKNSILSDIVLCKNNYSYDNRPILPQKMIVLSDLSLFDDQIAELGDVFIYNPDDYNQLPKKPNFLKPVFLNLFNIANLEDLELLLAEQDIIKSYDGIVANNVYAVELAKRLNLDFIPGAGLNIFNNYSLDLGAKYYIASPENYNNIKNAFVYSYGKFPLMTLKVCPIKSNCSGCAYNKKYYLKDDHNKCLKIRRVKLSRCYFQLLDDEALNLPQSKINGLVLYDFTDYNKNQIFDIINNIDNQKRYFPKVK
ncbi:MAG TPA: U32 family peptidase [Clostridia bacterium]